MIDDIVTVPHSGTMVCWVAYRKSEHYTNSGDAILPTNCSLSATSTGGFRFIKYIILRECESKMIEIQRGMKKKAAKASPPSNRLHRRG